MALRSDIPQFVRMQSLEFASAIPLTIDSTTMTNGYMNVFELPANGGAFRSGQVWSVADLRATFTSGTSVTRAVVPEPSAVCLLAAGGLGHVLLGRVFLRWACLGRAFSGWRRRQSGFGRGANQG